MKTFAYLIHPLDSRQYKNFIYAQKFIPPFIIKPFFRKTSPFQVHRVNGFQGYFIILHMLFEKTRDQALEAMELVLGAGKLAESLGVKILGLGGFTQLLCEKGYTALHALNIPLTGGSALSAWSAFEAIYRIARIKQLDLKKTSVAIINASSVIGSLCAKRLAEYAGKLVFVSHPDVEDKLHRLKDVILQQSPLEIAIENDPALALAGADVVIYSDDLPEASFDMASVKPGAILCDASVDRCLVAKAKGRADIDFIEAGLIKLPRTVKFSVNTGLPAGVVSASLAETMLLALKGEFVSYSLGDNIDVEKMDEIADIAAGCGFEVWVPQAPVL